MEFLARHKRKARDARERVLLEQNAEAMNREQAAFMDLQVSLDDLLEKV